jgi:cyclohexanecarboxylate-CoA ligase
MTMRPSEQIRENPVPGQKLALSDELIDRYRADGHWMGRTLRSLLTEAVAATPDAPALVGYRTDQASPERLTYREYDQRVDAAAWELHQLGVAAGDAVAVQLPNRVEFSILIFAIAQLGAVYVGIPVAYGEREMRAILRRSRARVLVTMPAWRSNRIQDTLRRLRADLPDLDTAMMLDSYEDELTEGEVPGFLGTTAPRPLRPTIDPIRLCHLGFTSGTTGEPKGVMNNHEALLAVMFGFLDHIGAQLLGDPIVQLVASPIGHHSGFLWGTLMTAHLGGTAVLMDQWDPSIAAEIIRSEGVTAMVNAPTFLQDLLETDLSTDEQVPLRTVVLAGSPVPRDLPRIASEALDAFVLPAWGMTEYGIAVSCSPSLPRDMFRTDGVPLASAEIAITTSDGEEAPDGVEGDLFVRGPGLFLGYYDRPDETSKAFTGDGWFHTGDRAVRDSTGAISLMGRSKDIIIRGGENIPVAEVESCIHSHPDIVQAAVVAVPDDRLGERAAAIIVLRNGTRMSLNELCRFLTSAGISKHFLPERLHIRDRLPMTMSGKIRKNQLRDELARATASVTE